jgi:hypothetical protein
MVLNNTRNNPSWGTISLYWWRNQDSRKGAKLKAHRKEQVLGQMLLQIFVKRHSIVKSHNKHPSFGLLLCIGRGIDMEKAPKLLGWRLLAPYMKFL